MKTTHTQVRKLRKAQVMSIPKKFSTAARMLANLAKVAAPKAKPWGDTTKAEFIKAYPGTKLATLLRASHWDNTTRIKLLSLPQGSEILADEITKAPHGEFIQGARVVKGKDVFVWAIA